MGDTRTLDYLSFSVKDYSRVQEISELLGLDFQPMGHGMGYWRSAAAAADRGAFLCADNFRKDVEESFYFDIRGSGMRAVERSDSFGSWPAMVQDLLDLGVSIKRVDAVIDNESGTIPFERVLGAVNRDEVVRRGSGHKLITNKTRQGVEQTLYIGSRQSEVMLRVYDKGLQLREGRSWLRFEFELKRDRAHEWCKVFAGQGWDAAYACLRGSIDFRVPGASVNRTRWAAAPWWVELVSQSRQVLTLGKAAVATIGKKMQWLERQACKAFALVTHAHGGDVGWFHLAMEAGQRKFRESDWRLIAEFEKAAVQAVSRDERRWGQAVQLGFAMG